MAREQKPKRTQRRAKPKQEVKKETEDDVVARRCLRKWQACPYKRTAPLATFYPLLPSVRELPLAGGVSFSYGGREGIRLSERDQLVARHLKNRDKIVPHPDAKWLSKEFVVHFMWKAYPTSDYSVKFREPLSTLAFVNTLCKHLAHFTQNVAPTLECADPEWSLGPGGKYGVDDLVIRQAYTSDGTIWYLDIQVLMSPEAWTRRPENRQMINDAYESANVEIPNEEDTDIQLSTVYGGSYIPLASSSSTAEATVLVPTPTPITPSAQPATEAFEPSPSFTTPGLSPIDTPSPAGSFDHTLATPSASPSAHGVHQSEVPANVGTKAPLSIEDMFVFAPEAQVHAGGLVMNEDPFAFLSTLSTCGDFDALFGTASAGFGNF